MKRWLALFLLIIYSFTSSGATLYFHFCSSGKTNLVSFSKEVASHDNCSLCLKKDSPKHDNIKMSCHPMGNVDSTNKCKDVKLDLEQSSDTYYSSGQQINSFTLFAPAVITLLWVYNFNPIEDIAIPHLLSNINSSPPISGTRSHLLHCNFRI